MAKCYHSGLPMSMCAHCSGARGPEAEPFRGTSVDDTPHRVKGVWKGRGENLPTPSSNDPRLREALLDSSPYVRRPISDWGREQVLRSIHDTLRMFKPDAIPALAALGELKHTLKNANVQGAAAPLLPGALWTRPENDAQVLKTAPPKKWAVRPPTQTIKHARSAGASATRASARNRS